MAFLRAVATSNNGKVGLKNPITSKGTLTFTQGSVNGSDIAKVGAYTGVPDSSLLLFGGVAFSKMLARRGGERGAALQLYPSCFLRLRVAEVALLLLLRMSSLLGAGRSLSSGVASLKSSR